MTRIPRINFFSSVISVSSVVDFQMRINMMLGRRNNRGWLRLGLGACLGVLLLLGGVWAFNNLDWEQRHYDPERLEKLAKIEVPPTNSNSDIRIPNFQEGDWPQWRGPNRDGLSLETGLSKTWSAQGPSEVWRSPIGRGFSSVVVVGKRLYTMDEESVLEGAPAPMKPAEGVLCLDALTGRQLWRFRSPVSYSERFGSGPRSTPAVDRNRVYAACQIGRV